MDYVLRRGFFFIIAAIAPVTAGFADAVDFPALLAKAKAGDAKAELDVSAAYYNGKGVPQDYRKAYDCSLEAAIQGNLLAEENVGLLYDRGHGVHENQTKAFDWYLKVAQNGRADAERAVGVRLQFGTGTPQNMGKAVDWLRAAAIQGESEAQTRLGDNLMNGIGGKKDLEQGFAYLMQSSAGFPFARYIVAKCYANGLYVPLDPMRAYAWCLIAPQTTKQAQDLTATLKGRLTADQIEEATDLSSRILKLFQEGNYQSDSMRATLDNGSSVTMKFDDVLGHIVVPLTLQNKKQVNFMIDTGCSMSVIDSRIASRFNLTGKDLFPMSGVGTTIELGTMAENVRVEGSGLSITGARMILLPGFNFDEYLGRPLAGVIGTDILKQFIIRIDYVNKTLTFALPGQLPEDPKTMSLPLTLNLNVPFIDAAMGRDASRNFPGHFLVDTGAGDALSLTKTFQENNPALVIDKAVQSGYSGIGGDNMTDIGRGTLTLGNFHMAKVPTDLDQSRQGNWSGLNGGVIGQGIWSRFNLTLDFPAHKLFLQPNENFAHPFRYTYCGLAVKTIGGDYRTFIVYEVVPDSPADSVGLQKGDQIVQLDKRMTKTMTMDEIDDLLVKEGTHEVQVLRNGTIFAFQLPVFDPFKHPEQIALYRRKTNIDPATPKIQSVAVQYTHGPALYPDDVIVRASGLHTGDLYRPEIINQATRKLYDTGLFANVTFTGETAPNGAKVTIILQPNSLVKSVALTGLSPAEEAKIRPQMIAEEGRRISNFDLFNDARLIKQLLGKANPAERTVSIDIQGEDGTSLHKEILIPKSAL